MKTMQRHPDRQPVAHRRHRIALACLLLAQTPQLMGAPLPLALSPPNSSSSEPAPNVVLSIDDSGSMAWELDPSNPGLGDKYQLLKQSLIAAFGNGTANSGVIPDGRIRLAWHTMHNNGGSPGARSLTPGGVNTIRPFSGQHRQNFYQFVQRIDPGNGTPALEMMERVFSYARTPQGLHSPWADNPGQAQSPSNKPYLSCRRMYNILLTDGAWNSQNASQRVGNGDSINHTLGDGTTPYNTASNQTLVYRDIYGDTVPNKASTLADFAFKAWATDMQDGTGGTAALPNDLRPLIRKAGNETFATPTCTANGNCIQTQEFWNPRNNPATWQNVSTYTIGFGYGTVNWTFRRNPVASSSLYYTNQQLFNDSFAGNRVMASAADIAQRATPVDWDNNNPSKDTFGGDLPRLVQGELQWPNPRSDQTSFNSEAEHTRPVELWHAAINGRGRFYPVTTPSGLTAAFLDIIGQVIKDTSTPLVSIATNSSSLRQGMVAYIAGYSAADGSGKLSARPIDPATGDVRPTEDWNAAALLDALTPAQIASRVVLSWDGTAGIAFKTLANLPNPAQLQLGRNASGSPDGLGQARLNYIRGDNSQTEDAGGPFRKRASRLGGIVNSSVLHVGPPMATHASDGYASFAGGRSSRAPMLYVGASDGMLHGFQTSNGAEKLAYVPLGAAQGRLRNLSDPGHEMQYLVDGSPFAGDAFLGTGSGWRTLLVGTGGNGLKGWFVLDITDPGAFSDANAPTLVINDVTASTDPDIGNISAPPAVDDSSGASRQIVKLNNGRWAVVLGNGVNSTNEAPVLMLQYVDGNRALIRLSPCPQPISSQACSFKGGNGLSTPALVDLNGDGIMDMAYAGDLQGHVWKFDLRGSNETSWGVAFGGQPLFVARRNTAVQPITSAPFVAMHPAGGLMVVVGTGQNLTVADRTSTAPQTLYGLWDNSSYGSPAAGTPINTVSAPTLSSLVQQTYNASPLVDNSTNYFVSSNNPVGYSGATPNRGWYMEWPLSGQRVVTNARPFAGQKVLVESMIPADGTNTQGETCNPTSQTGRRFLSVLNLFTGGVPATSPFTLTGANAGTTNATMLEVAAGGSALFKTPTRIKQIASNCPAGQTCAPQTWNPGQTLGARANWRQILQ